MPDDLSPLAYGRVLDKEDRINRRTGDVMLPELRYAIGGDLRLTIPMDDPGRFRDAAEILRGFANRLTVLAKERESVATILLMTKAEGRLCNARLRSLARPYRKNAARRVG